MAVVSDSLWVSKYVELMGGEIKLSSVYEQGTSVVFTIDVSDTCKKVNLDEAQYQIGNELWNNKDHNINDFQQKKLINNASRSSQF